MQGLSIPIRSSSSLARCSDVDVHTLIARRDLRDGAAARSRRQVRESDFVDEPRTENVHVADPELIHVTVDRLLHVVQVSLPRAAVAPVGEEVRVQLIAA